MRIKWLGTMAVICFFSVSLCYAQERLQCVEASIDSDEIEESDDIGQMCSLGCAMGWKVEASSYLHSTARDTFSVDRLNDGLISTSWIDGGKTNGIAETITFSFPRQYFIESSVRDSVPFHGFRVVNGLTSDNIPWNTYSRVKTLRIFHNGQPVFDIRLRDSKGIQEAESLSAFHIKPDDIVTVKILEVYPGRKFRHAAIAELVPLGAH